MMNHGILLVVLSGTLIVFILRSSQASGYRHSRGFAIWYFFLLQTDALVHIRVQATDDYTIAVAALEHTRNRQEITRLENSFVLHPIGNNIQS